jgi:membrane protease YdiL (CAAX protease family)
MNANDSQENLPLKYFFLLVFVLAIPFWWLGGYKLPLPINLPASALTTFVPMIAAAILYYRRSGFKGVKELLKKAWDYKKTKCKICYLPALLLAPAIYLLSYLSMRLTGLPLPAPIKIPLRMVPVFFLMFFVGDTGEELGWSGYATDPMQKRCGALKASLILGVVWAIWHTIPFVQSGYSASWVVWQFLKTVSMRIVIVWIYNKTGKSVFAATLYHTHDNVSWALFPNYGSHYNPFVTTIMTCLTAGIVMFGWGAKTSGRNGQAGAGSHRV